MHYTDAPAAVGGPIRKVHEHKMIGVDIPLTDDFPGREETIKAVDSLLLFLQNILFLRRILFPKIHHSK